MDSLRDLFATLKIAPALSREELDETCSQCGKRRGAHRAVTEECMTVEVNTSDPSRTWTKFRRAQFRRSGESARAEMERCGRCSKPRFLHAEGLCTDETARGKPFIASGQFGGGAAPADYADPEKPDMTG